MLLYRITHTKYATGELYASGRSGRFNSEGRKVIYTAGSISLALLENMVHSKGEGLEDLFRTLVIYAPEDIDVTAIAKKDLPAGWNSDHSYCHTQPIGDAWFDNATTAILRVPSAIVPQEYNYILNTEHPDFKKIITVDVLPLYADSRIDELITKYQNK